MPSPARPRESAVGDASRWPSACCCHPLWLLVLTAWSPAWWPSPSRSGGGAIRCSLGSAYWFAIVFVPSRDRLAVSGGSTTPTSFVLSSISYQAWHSVRLRGKEIHWEDVPASTSSAMGFSYSYLLTSFYVETAPLGPLYTACRSSPSRGAQPP